MTLSSVAFSVLSRYRRQPKKTRKHWTCCTNRLTTLLFPSPSLEPRVSFYEPRKIPGEKSKKTGITPKSWYLLHAGVLPPNRLVRGEWKHQSRTVTFGRTGPTEKSGPPPEVIPNILVGITRNIMRCISIWRLTEISGIYSFGKALTVFMCRVHCSMASEVMESFPFFF